MNIIVERFSDEGIHCRPDTTWERENRDFYAPDSVSGLWWSPIVFARICKAGKCIGKKFASRYYDGCGFGALLYIGENMPDYATASCADHTSILPHPLYNPVVLENAENVFEMKKDGMTIFCSNGTGYDDERKGQDFIGLIEEAICKASKLTSLRTGDFIAIELAQASHLSSREDADARLEATYCGNSLIDMKIIY